MDQVKKTVIDLKYTAWRKGIQGIKTGNSKKIMQIEEQRPEVLKTAEDHEIPLEAQEVLG